MNDAGRRRHAVAQTGVQTATDHPNGDHFADVPEDRVRMHFDNSYARELEGLYVRSGRRRR